MCTVDGDVGHNSLEQEVVSAGAWGTRRPWECQNRHVTNMGDHDQVSWINGHTEVIDCPTGLRDGDGNFILSVDSRRSADYEDEFRACPDGT